MFRVNISQVLVEYDCVPHVLLFKDENGNMYLATLYRHDAKDSAFIFLGVLMTSERLSQFLHNEVDLRSMYTSPETDNDLYDIRLRGECATAELYAGQLEEAMLPDDGFYCELDFVMDC